MTQSQLNNRMFKILKDLGILIMTPEVQDVING